jgi:hypothetical protein
MVKPLQIGTVAALVYSLCDEIRVGFVVCVRLRMRLPDRSDLARAV